MVLKIFHSHLLMEHLVKKSSEDCFFFSLLRQKLRDNLMGPAEEAFSLLYLRFYSEFFELSQQPLTVTLGHF